MTCGKMLATLNLYMMLLRSTYRRPRTHAVQRRAPLSYAFVPTDNNGVCAKCEGGCVARDSWPEFGMHVCHLSLRPESADAAAAKHRAWQLAGRPAGRLASRLPVVVGVSTHTQHTHNAFELRCVCRSNGQRGTGRCVQRTRGGRIFADTRAGDLIRRARCPPCV